MVGTALLSTIFASAAAGYTATHPHLATLATVAQAHGQATAFWWSTAIYAFGLLAAACVLATPRCWRRIRRQAVDDLPRSRAHARIPSARRAKLRSSARMSRWGGDMFGEYLL